MTSEDYSEKLKDARWNEFRLTVFQRDEYECLNCGFKGRLSIKTYAPTRGLQAHHNYYEAGKDPWDYPLTAMLTLCAICHEAETKWRGETEAGLLDSLRRSGFLGSDLVRLRERIEKEGPSRDRTHRIVPDDTDERESERNRRRQELGLDFDRFGNSYGFDPWYEE